MSGFSFSVRKPKNLFQRQKELEEEKKKRDDEEAAKVYEEFVAAFAGEEKEKGPKAFVRGGTIQPGSSTPAMKKAGGKGGYVPSFIPPGMAAAVAGASGGGGGDKRDNPEKKEESLFQPPSSNRGKVRSIDLLLQNLKKEQEQRATRKEQGLPPVEEGMGSFDTGDPTTTNLYIGNLAPDVDEHVLMREFGRFGPIGSVKVMWPRDEEQRRRGRNNGFVAFMRREDADRAKDALDGVVLHDLSLSIGWGKAVPLPRAPCWPPPGGLAAAREGGAAVPPPVGAPEDDRHHHHHNQGHRGSRGHSYDEEGPKLRRGGGAGGHVRVVTGVGPDIEVEIPADPRQRFVVDAVAFYVMRDGTEFEQVIMEREHSNPEFGFLFDVRCPEHAYYRWRLFSLANGDSLRSWRVEPFLMVEDSNRWLPPPMTLGAPDHKTAAQRGDRREDRPLSDLQRDKFEDMLRRLTVERADICAAMAFAMDNAESASEVVEVLTDALTLAETAAPLKIARLFLVSDILHNTTAPVRNASRYRSRLEEQLPDIFESLQEAYRSCESRMSQELLRRHVLRVLRAWRGWFIFGDDFLNGLQATFLRGSSEGAGAATNAELEAELDALAPEELEARCRRAGLSCKGGKSAQVSRLLSLDAYLNGEKAGGSGGQAAQPGAAVRGGGSAGGAAGSRPGSAGGGASGWEDVTDVPPEPARQLSKWERAEAEGQEANGLQEAAAGGPRESAAAAALPGPLASSRWAAGEEEREEGGGGPAAGGATPGGAQRAPSHDPTAAGGGGSEDEGDIFAGFGVGKGEAEGATPRPPSAQTGDGAAAAAAATPRAPSAADAGGAGAEKPDAADEERRQRLRQVEVAVMLLREELEERGVGGEELERRVAQHRAKLVAEAEAAAAAAAEPPSASRDSGKASKPHRGRSHKERDRDKEREREGRRSRSPHRSRRSSRSRSPQRRRSRSRSKSPPKRSRSGREKEREREREGGSQRDRSRSRSRERRRR